MAWRVLKGAGMRVDMDAGPDPVFVGLSGLAVVLLVLAVASRLQGLL